MRANVGIAFLLLALHTADFSLELFRRFVKFSAEIVAITPELVGRNGPNTQGLRMFVQRIVEIRFSKGKGQHGSHPFKTGWKRFSSPLEVQNDRG